MLALFDEANYYAIDVGYPMQTLAYGGWRCEQWQTDRGFELRFFPPEPMKRGNIYDLQFQLEPPPGDPDNLGERKLIREESLAFHERTLAAQFSAKFVGQKPRSIGGYTGRTFNQRPRYVESGTKLDLGNDQSVAATYKGFARWALFGSGVGVVKDQENAHFRYNYTIVTKRQSSR